MVRIILFGVAIIGGLYMYEVQTGDNIGVRATIDSVIRGFAGGYGFASGGSGGAGGAVSGVANGAGRLATGAANALGN